MVGSARFPTLKSSVSRVADQPHGESHRHPKDWWEKLIPILLAFTFAATVVAVVFTRQQADIARDTARKQLRAYVGVEIGRPIIGAEGEITAILTLTNSGQTPANGVQTAVQIVTGALPINTAERPPYQGCDFITVRQQGSSPAYIQPGDKRGLRFPITNGVTEAMTSQLGTGEAAALYIFGTVCYRDIYNEVRWTEYCLAFAGRDLSPQIPCVHGERAD